MPDPRSRRLRRAPRSDACLRFGPAFLGVAVVLAACGTAGRSTGTPATSISADPSASATSGASASARTIAVYFTDGKRFAAGVEPYEVPVERPAPSDAGPRAVLDAFFAGPTDAERAAGLMAVTSGFTGVRSVQVENGVADVFLEGRCASNGATYTIAGAIKANLLPFPEIAWVKIHDETGATERPAGQVDSIPICLEP